MPSHASLLCDICRDEIKVGDEVSEGGKSYHPHCKLFSCSKCGKDTTGYEVYHFTLKKSFCGDCATAIEESFDNMVARHPRQPDQDLDAVMRCPRCKEFHIDEGEWRHRSHSRHLCAFCANIWFCAGWYYNFRGVAPTRWEMVKIWWKDLWR